MLVKFAVSNFHSFRDRVEFSLIPSKERVHRDQHVHKATNHSTDLLRAAVIFGANASGKSNFIKAITFAKQFVIKGVRPGRSTGTTTFKLDEGSRAYPSEFYFEIIINSKTYIYEFVLNRDAVLKEKLSVKQKNTTKELFNREFKEDLSTSFSFGSGMDKSSKEKNQFLNFIADGTRINKLFLSESVERNIKQFEDLFHWFDKGLKIYTPKTMSDGLEFRIENDKSFEKFLTRVLHNFDPSVDGIKIERVEAKKSPDLPAALLKKLEEDLEDRQAVIIADPLSTKRAVICKENGELILLKLLTQHKCVDSNRKITFDLEEESDGTRRVIELAPLFYELTNSVSSVVAFVDELDRSLHPLLTKKLLELFLTGGFGKESQIIVSTHDSNLLDTSLLRRDEVWFIQKHNGVSKLLSLQKDFAPRHDKDIRKDYLNGEYGGIYNKFTLRNPEDI